MSVLKIKDSKGRWVGIPSIRGEDGTVEIHASEHEIGGRDELTPEMIGASPVDHSHTLEELGAASKDHTHSLEEFGAASEEHTHTPEEIGAAKAEHTHTLESLGAAPAYSYGTADLTAGTSKLDTGKVHYVYE